MMNSIIAMLITAFVIDGCIVWVYIWGNRNYEKANEVLRITDKPLHKFLLFIVPTLLVFASIMPCFLVRLSKDSSTDNPLLEIMQFLNGSGLDIIFIMIFCGQIVKLLIGSRSTPVYGAENVGKDEAPQMKNDKNVVMLNLVGACVLNIFFCFMLAYWDGAAIVLAITLSRFFWFDVPDTGSIEAVIEGVKLQGGVKTLIMNAVFVIVFFLAYKFVVIPEDIFVGIGSGVALGVIIAFAFLFISEKQRKQKTKGAVSRS